MASDDGDEMKLVMTLKVRDEDDVLEDNLRFHHALGVDFFIVTDNGSVDRTPEILARYTEAGLAHVIRDETSELRIHEVRWATDMARLAATEYGADWVFHGDAARTLAHWPRLAASQAAEQRGEGISVS